MTLHKDRETASPGQETIELQNTYHDTKSTYICSTAFLQGAARLLYSTLCLLFVGAYDLDGL